MAYGTQNAPMGIQPYSSITGGSWVDKLNQYSIDPTFNNAGWSVSGYASYFGGDPVEMSTLAPTIAKPVTGTVLPFLTIFSDDVPGVFEGVTALGAFVSCEYYDATGKYITDNKWIGGTPTYLDASGDMTLVKAFISDDPQVVYDVQVSTHVNNEGANLAAFTSPAIFPNTNTNEGDGFEGGIGSNFALTIGDGVKPPAATTGFDLVSIPGGNGAKYRNNPAVGNATSGQSAYYLDVSAYVGGDATHDYDKRTATLPFMVTGITPQNTVLPGYTLATTPFINVLGILNNHQYGHGQGQSGADLSD